MPTNQNRDEHAAVQRLRAFFTDMHAWEAEAKRQSKEEVRAGKLDPAEAFTRIQGSLRTVFHKHCEEGSVPTRLEPGNLHYGAHRPLYDPDGERILAVVFRTPDVVEIVTETTHLSPVESLVYELVHQNGQWRIRDNRRRRGRDGRLVPWDL